MMMKMRNKKLGTGMRLTDSIFKIFRRIFMNKLLIIYKI